MGSLKRNTERQPCFGSGHYSFSSYLEQFLMIWKQDHSDQDNDQSNDQSNDQDSDKEGAGLQAFLAYAQGVRYSTVSYADLAWETLGKSDFLKFEHILYLNLYH